MRRSKDRTLLDDSFTLAYVFAGKTDVFSGSDGGKMMTILPSFRVSSCRTTALAPLGMIAPVIMRAASPLLIFLVAIFPAGRSSMIFNFTGFREVAPCTSEE